MTATVLRRPDEEQQLRSRSREYALRPAGWFGTLFLIIGLGDMALVWYPLYPGNPTWEFGAIQLSFSTLPVLTIGLGACMIAALAGGSRRLAAVLGVGSVGLGLLCIMGYLLFLTDVPLALRNSPPEVLGGIRKTIYRTSLFGLAFATAYLGAGIAMLRHLKRHKKDGKNGN